MTRGKALRSSVPFIVAAIVCALTLVPHAANASAPGAPAFGHAVVVRENGEPVLKLDGKPFFFLGGAFFYERIPRSRWRDAMERMRELGANTLDLYVPWNWHELSDGDFDFTGRTNPRRDLREVLRLGKELGFVFIVRPGPVIRNEWRNGGYPAWLLQRPEYGMPLHDVLEGRYPATATLQNAHSDDAAAEWMRNATHVRYASRWLHRALAEFKPVADRVIAVQLDDDQGAYLDNDTYPAPHLRAYLNWLEQQARDVVGPRTPVFINTFEMKVPSSSPAWAMGNWYQSDARTIGEHDRAELAFATATLRTQDRGPLAISEFQAGWLASPEDPQPRQADRTNTSLALGELAGWGVKGVIDFPPFETLAPFGWEAPFSNALYAWDAAFELDLSPRSEFSAFDYSSRWYTTRRSFAALAAYGPALAEARRVADIGIPYDGRVDAFRAAASLKEALATCRARNLACDAFDPLNVSDERLRRFRQIVGPLSPQLAARALRLHVRVGPPARGGPEAAVQTTLLRGPHGTFIVVENWANHIITVSPADVPAEARSLAPFVLGARDFRILALHVDLPFISSRYVAGDTLSTSCGLSTLSGNAPFFDGSPGPDALDVTPAADLRGPMCEIDAMLSGRHEHWTLRRFESLDLHAYALPPGGNLTIDSGVAPGIVLAPRITFPSPHVEPVPAGTARAERIDVFGDGDDDVVLRNARVAAIVVPQGGARIIEFGKTDLGPSSIGMLQNLFDATGGLRDDVLVQPPPSATDRIAKYTHTYPAGMFNRPYAACTFSSTRGAGAYLAYDAPDVVPNGARFERVVTLAPDAERLVVDERFTPNGTAPQQRLVSLSALRPLSIAGAPNSPAAGPVAIDPSRGGVSLHGAFDDLSGYSALAVSWRPQDVEAATWLPSHSNGTLRLVFAPGGWRRVTFAPQTLRSEAAFGPFVEAERAWVAANRPPTSDEDGEVAKRYTQSPQKRPSESSCGFESHLP